MRISKLKKQKQKQERENEVGHVNWERVKVDGFAVK